MNTLRILPLLLASSMAASGFELINVNFHQFTPGPGDPEAEASLEGPAGGLGTTWNQYAANSSSGVVLDSAGEPTTVTVATNFAEGRGDGTGPSLTMLRATLTDFGRGLSRTVTLNGLEPGGSYDVWLVSHRHQAGTLERQKGTWSTANPTAFPGLASQVVDGTDGALNGSSFVSGVNFALFQSVEADSEGVITFSGKGAAVADGFDDNYRLHLNGLQIAPAAPVVPPEPLEFTDITVSEDRGEVALTWKSNPGEVYGLYWSTDLEEFHMHGMHHAIPAHASENRTSLGPIPNPVPDAERMFFLVGPPDPSAPELSQAFGSGDTVTLRFSEPIDPHSVGDLANFTVTLDGTPIPVTAATLSPGGNEIILTIDAVLAPGTTYAVGAENITTPAGRVIPDTFSGSFQTWDNDADGVQVFLLIGQSNMVGHGKVNEGGNPDFDPALPSGPDNPREIPAGLGSLRNLVINDEDFPDVDYRRLLVDPAEPETSDWIAREDVKIWWRSNFIGSPRVVRKGDLTNGFGQGSTWFGPEYGFGWAVGDHFADRPVLLLKLAWGGISLVEDLRPPSAVAERGGETGPYYLELLDIARETLGGLGGEFPEFEGMGYRIAGVGFHQGWNDRVSDSASAEYEANLVDFIDDIRAEFGNPDLPFSITTTAMDPPEGYTTVELAQLALADAEKYPRFQDNLRVTDARPFWRPQEESPSNFGFHWNHNGESQYLNGTAMGEKMIELLELP